VRTGVFFTATYNAAFTIKITASDVLVVWIAIVDLFEAIAPAEITLLLAGAFLFPYLFEQLFYLFRVPQLMAAEDRKPFGSGDIAEVGVREFVV
jgi:hypothetical protein